MEIPDCFTTKAIVIVIAVEIRLTLKIPARLTAGVVPIAVTAKFGPVGFAAGSLRETASVIALADLARP